MLAYLSRYTHRVAISNSRPIAADAESVTFKVKDYRIEGPGRYTTMTLGAHEFIRRFLIHVLPKGFHRIRHVACPGPDPGASSPAAREERLARARELLDAASIATDPEDEAAADLFPPLLAGSFFGGFRTPAPVPSRTRSDGPASEPFTKAVVRQNVGPAGKTLLRARAGGRSPAPWTRRGCAGSRPPGSRGSRRAGRL